MKQTLFLLLLFILIFSGKPGGQQKIFDVHLHAEKDLTHQLKTLQEAGVYKAAFSSSWEQQEKYSGQPGINMLFGLMFPCPLGKVPYSLQPCFENGNEWPSIHWVEDQIKNGRIHFMGEVLSQYYGISSSDSLLFPYYALAEKYELPVGIHTGGAGPNHGSPNFKMELGNPLLLENTLKQFPRLRVWIMHSGDQFYKETITMMLAHKNLYADISVISNPFIVPPAQFTTIMKAFHDAGLTSRLMFGTDNGPIDKAVEAVENLDFLSRKEKKMIFYKNAEKFFGIAGRKA